MVMVLSDRNRGFSGGNNLCLRPALETNHYDYFLLANSDIEFTEESLGILMNDAASDSSKGIWGCSIVYGDTPQKVQCAGGWKYNPLLTTVKPVLEGTEVTRLVDAPPQQMDYVYGACMLVRSEVFLTCGVLNEDLFLYYEEIDLCLRARQKGFDLGWSRGAIVRHAHAYTTQKLKQSLREYHEMWGVLTITGKHYPYLLPWVLLIRCTAKTVLLAGRGRFGLIPWIYRASADYLWGCTEKDTERVNT
ncbi:hypothetical protein PSDVSF_12180 [Pseudodesulfovibrio sediminis]|uniref:Glycosyltransferase 2-like domain-containing protein n=2 Tax=Pseudodesulfovibrio sediminis TaxID=2810563 RepID=A0ABN6ENV5_9BACT|nr:hypothetical protein PSDVSF_12180 [Pseudodesulfovibrio sediminis]